MSLKDGIIVFQKILKNTKPFQCQLQKKSKKIGKDGKETVKTLLYKLKLLTVQNSYSNLIIKSC